MQVTFYVYILRCSDHSYYTGHTDNLEKRLSEHFLNTIPNYTSNKHPLKLVFVQTFGTRDEAIQAERQIKGWSRKKKDALINDDWKELIRLSNLK